MHLEGQQPSLGKENSVLISAAENIFWRNACEECKMNKSGTNPGTRFFPQTILWNEGLSWKTLISINGGPVFESHLHVWAPLNDRRERRIRCETAPKPLHASCVPFRWRQQFLRWRHSERRSSRSSVHPTKKTLSSISYSCILNIVYRTVLTVRLWAFVD